MERGRVVVTGGAGFIGSHLVERLLLEGYQVTVIDNLSTGSVNNLRAVLGNPAFELITCKISAYPDLDRLARSSSFIFHLAATVGVELAVREPIQTLINNVHETEVLLRSASRYGTGVLVASSSEVYGRSRRREFSEEDDLQIGCPTIPRWGYACSKLLDEFLAFAYSKEKGLPVIVCRIFNTVGPRQSGRYGMVLPRFIEAALEGRPLIVYGDGRQRRCFCYVGDTVEAMVRLMQCEKARGQIFNVGSSEEVSIRELARRVIRLLGSSSRIEFVPYEKVYPEGFEDMRRRRPSLKKLQDYIGYVPQTSLDKAIRLTAAAIKAEMERRRFGLTD